MSDNKNEGFNTNPFHDMTENTPQMPFPLPTTPMQLDALEELQYTAKAEVILQSSPVTRDLYAIYLMINRLIDVIKRYDEFEEEHAKVVKEIGEKIVDILYEKAKELDIEEKALKLIINKKVFE